MSTRKDVESKLRAMDSGDLYFIAAAFKQEQRLARDSEDGFIEWLLKGYDSNPQLQVMLLRELDLPTADEVKTDAASKALDAAQRSANAAERSANTAERSAIAAEKSEQHAQSMKHARWIALGLSSAALLVAVGHIFVNVVIAITKGQQ